MVSPYVMNAGPVENWYGALLAPFPAELIKWRVGSTTQDKSRGLALAYIDARDVMVRFDEAVGPENWQSKLIPTPGGMICEIGIKIQDYWVWKSNSAEDTNIEAIKGAGSDAFKRAAVLWGVGRYLYYLDNIWVDLENKKIKNPPKLPEWALPKDPISIVVSADVVNEKAINEILKEVKKLKGSEQKLFKGWLENNNLTFGVRQDDGSYKGWNIEDKHLESIYNAISNIVEPLDG